MSRLIDADLLKENLLNRLSVRSEEYLLAQEKFIRKVINEQPTVDTEPVRHGKWIDQYDDGNWHCSVCGAIVEKDEQDRHNWYRCYHCGAKMDEVTE